MHPGLKLAASHVARRLPRSRPTAFYDSFGGAFADNPRALFETAQIRPWSGGGLNPAFGHVWCIRDGVTGPEDAATVRPGSAAFTWAISQADVIFANSGLPRYFETRPGSTFVQTWHGTPLKRIGFDIADPRFAGGSKYFERLRRDVERWDVLVSPNAFSSDVFRSAFHFEGRIVETGYPRNDMLVSSGAESQRTRTRATLGIPASATTILYAPTWRDAEIGEDGQQAHALALDPHRLTRELGDVVVLLRLHPLVAGSALPEGGRVRNVSHHPDMRELLLAADVLVTDYSSSMFDFAVTGKPLVFYAYDLDRYANEGRGFYFDLLAEAPGPVVSTEDELIAVLQDPGSLTTSYQASYRTFQQRFCHLDDGHAAERVLAAVFSGDS